jgi:hypothetical protein
MKHEKSVIKNYLREEIFSHIFGSQFIHDVLHRLLLGTTVTIWNVCKTPYVHQGTTSPDWSGNDSKGPIHVDAVQNREVCYLDPLIGIYVNQFDNQVSDIGNSDSDGNGSTLQTGLRETNL